jgi:hypothetical protein
MVAVHPTNEKPSLRAVEEGSTRDASSPGTGSSDATGAATRTSNDTSGSMKEETLAGAGRPEDNSCLDPY